MKFPVCNVDLLVGERLTLQRDCYQIIHGTWLEKDTPDKLIETAVDRRERDTTRDFRRIG